MPTLGHPLTSSLWLQLSAEVEAVSLQLTDPAYTGSWLFQDRVIRVQESNNSFV